MRPVSAQAQRYSTKLRPYAARYSIISREPPSTLTSGSTPSTGASASFFLFIYLVSPLVHHHRRLPSRIFASHPPPLPPTCSTGQSSSKKNPSGDLKTQAPPFFLFPPPRCFAREIKSSYANEKLLGWPTSPAPKSPSTARLPSNRSPKRQRRPERRIPN